MAALHSYRDLFLDQGNAVHKAMEWARNPTGPDLEKVVPFELYTKTTKAVFEQGHVCRIEPESGRPSIQTVGTIPVEPGGVNRERLAQ